MWFTVSQTHSLGGVGSERDEANLADVQVRAPPAILINTAEEGQELHFEEGREKSIPFKPVGSQVHDTLCHSNAVSRKNRLQNLMEVLCQCLTAPWKLQTHVCLSPHPTGVFSSLLISALPCAPVCPVAAAGARSGVWSLALRVQCFCQDTCSEELPGRTKGSNHCAQWLHTGLKAPRWHSWTQ